MFLFYTPFLHTAFLPAWPAMAMPCHGMPCLAMLTMAMLTCHAFAAHCSHSWLLTLLTLCAWQHSSSWKQQQHLSSKHPPMCSNSRSVKEKKEGQEEGEEDGETWASLWMRDSHPSYIYVAVSCMACFLKGWWDPLDIYDWEVVGTWVSFVPSGGVDTLLPSPLCLPLHSRHEKGLALSLNTTSSCPNPSL